MFATNPKNQWWNKIRFSSPDKRNALWLSTAVVRFCCSPRQSTSWNLKFFTMTSAGFRMAGSAYSNRCRQVLMVDDGSYDIRKVRRTQGTYEKMYPEKERYNTALESRTNVKDNLFESIPFVNHRSRISSNELIVKRRRNSNRRSYLRSRRSFVAGSSWWNSRKHRIKAY